MFIEGRYIASMQAAYRIFGFSMHSKSHTVIRLGLHIENEQELIVNAENIDTNLITKNSMLMGWMELNKIDRRARKYFYHEIPQHYVWKTKDGGQWTERERGTEKTLSRMFTISPKQIELFNLRILLLHIPGKYYFINFIYR